MRTKSVNKSEINHDWWVADAEDQTLGRFASRIAQVLRGKHKPYYTPHVDCGDYVVVIYNPSSKKRIHQLQDTRKLLLKYRSPSTPVAIIKGAYRESQSIVVTDLEHMEEYADKLGMISTVIVGNSSTYNFNDLMINPRGYKSKYSLQAQQKMQN